MSEVCRQYCPHFKACEARLNAAERIYGYLHQTQYQIEETITKARSTDTALQIAMVGAEFEHSVGGAATEFAPDEDTGPTALKLQRLKWQFGTVLSTMARLDESKKVTADRIEANAAELARVSVASMELEEDAAACPGPGVSRLGKFLIWGDRMVSNPTLPEYYLFDHAVCGSRQADATMHQLTIDELLPNEI